MGEKKTRGVFEQAPGSKIWWGAVKWIAIAAVVLFCLHLFQQELSWLLCRVAGLKFSDSFWIAMTPITTLAGFTFIYWQIRHGVNSADVNLVFSLRDRFWSADMVKVRQDIKSPGCIAWLNQLKSGDISAKDVKVYSETFIPQFTIFDFFESIGALCRRDKRLLKLIEPLLGGISYFTTSFTNTFTILMR
jgi:hypothetical protein